MLTVLMTTKYSRGRSGLSRRGRRQLRQGDHSQGQIQESEQAAKGLAQRLDWRCFAFHQLCAAGYNLRWLLRTVACLGAGAVFASVASSAVTAAGRRDVIRCVGRVWTATMRNRIANVVVKKMIFVHAVQGAY